MRLLRGAVTVRAAPPDAAGCGPPAEVTCLLHALPSAAGPRAPGANVTRAGAAAAAGAQQPQGAGAAAAAGGPPPRVKLVLLGDSGVGKSCLVLRYVRGQFDESSKITVSGWKRRWRMLHAW